MEMLNVGRFRCLIDILLNLIHGIRILDSLGDYGTLFLTLIRILILKGKVFWYCF